MRTIACSAITEAVAKLCSKACCQMPENLLCAVKAAKVAEPSPVGKGILDQVLENAAIAASENIPICQDTGLAVFFVEIGQEVHIEGGNFEDAINEGVRRGYVDGYLRKSSVQEPLFERVNTKDNTPAVIHVRLVSGDGFKITMAPKGAGSENKSVLKMLVPADGMAGVKKVFLDTVLAAGPNSCPPMVIGVGIGGDMELAAILAKRAAIREAGSRNLDPRYAKLEEELLELANKTGIGPQGLGGKTTALAVHVEFAATHIAMLPLAININCNAARHASMEL